MAAEAGKVGEWPDRKCLLGWYLPRGEPRSIPEGAIIDRSVIERMAEVSSYRPINMPVSLHHRRGADPARRGMTGPAVTGMACLCTDARFVDRRKSAKKRRL